MSCPTCDHTMQTIVSEHWRKIAWCPRCGTLKTNQAVIEGYKKIATPKLIDFAREFESAQDMSDGNQTGRDWKRTGCAESIRLPQDRK